MEPTASSIWNGLTPSQRATLLCEHGFSLSDKPRETLQRAGIAYFAANAARAALGKRALLSIGKSVPAPSTFTGWHTPRSLTDMGVVVAEYGIALLRAEISMESS